MSRISTLRTYQPRRAASTPKYRLDELFDDEELPVKLMIAKYRILMAFDHATFWSHGKQRGTDNFIVGVGHRQKDLTHYVIECVVKGMGRKIVTASELPGFVGDNSSVLRKVARETERQLVAVQLAMLSPDYIWFNAQTPGTWNVAPSLMDDYRLNRELVHEVKRVDARLRREALHGGGRLAVVH
jgi:hypothetical protein